MKQNSSGKATTFPVGLLSGSLVSIGTTLGGSAILAKLVDTGRMQWHNIGYGITGMLLLAGYLGAFTACRRIKHRRIMVSAMAGMLYFLILLSATALFFDGQYEAVGVTGLLVMGGSLCAGLIPASRQQGTHKSTTRRKYR